MIMCSMADQVQDDFEFERDPIELAGQFEGDIILPSHDNTLRVRKQTKKRKKSQTKGASLAECQYMYEVF